MKNLKNTVNINKLVKVALPKYNAKSNAFYEIIDVQKYINNLYEDYKQAIEDITKQNKMDYLKDFVEDIDETVQVPSFTKDDLKKYHTETEWYDQPNAGKVLKQMQNIDTEYALMIDEVNMDCSNIILLPLTKEALDLIINDKIKPSDKGINWNDKMCLEENDIAYLKKVQALTQNGTAKWIDCSHAYPKQNDNSIVKTNLPEDL